MEFFDFRLRGLGIRDAVDSLFFPSCQVLKNLVNKAEVPPLLVALYARLLVPAAASASPTLPPLTGIQDLFWEYVSTLNSAICDQRLSDAEVHRALTALAWVCISKASYRPSPCDVSDALKALDDNDAIAHLRLAYLESALTLIETIKPRATHVAFLVDPLAEYFAAEHLMRAFATRETEWGFFIAYVTAEPENLERCIGFCRAVVNTAATLQQLPERRLNAISELDKKITTFEAAARQPPTAPPRGLRRGADLGRRPHHFASIGSSPFGIPTSPAGRQQGPSLARSGPGHPFVRPRARRGRRQPGG